MRRSRDHRCSDARCTDPSGPLVETALVTWITTCNFWTWVTARPCVPAQTPPPPLPLFVVIKAADFKRSIFSGAVWKMNNIHEVHWKRNVLDTFLILTVIYIFINFLERGTRAAIHECRWHSSKPKCTRINTGKWSFKMKTQCFLVQEH